MDYAQRQLAFAAMRAALASTERQRRDIDWQIRVEAEARVRALYPEWRAGHGRLQSRWSGLDERRYDQHLVRLHFERGRELDALDRKIERQCAAIAAFRAKHGINEPAEMAA